MNHAPRTIAAAVVEGNAACVRGRSVLRPQLGGGENNGTLLRYLPIQSTKQRWDLFAAAMYMF